MVGLFFLFPLLWSGWASVRTDSGFGFENYARLFTADDGIGFQHVWNSIAVAALTTILLHALRPGLITVALFAPLILLNSTDRFTMTLAVVNMRTATHGSIDYAALEAGVVVMAVPCLLLFLFMQRGYVRGFMSGALKG